MTPVNGPDLYKLKQFCTSVDRCQLDFVRVAVAGQPPNSQGRAVGASKVPGASRQSHLRRGSSKRTITAVSHLLWDTTVGEMKCRETREAHAQTSAPLSAR